MGLTAEVLISYLQDINVKLKKVERMKKSVKKGEAYYRLMAYSQAIETMNALEKSGASQKLYFYRERSFEEVGDTKKAISDYRKAIAMNQSSSLAKNANRRLYLLGSVYGDSAKLKNESQQNAVKLKDTSFIKKSSAISNAVDSKRVSVMQTDVATKETREFVEEQTSKPMAKPGIKPEPAKAARPEPVEKPEKVRKPVVSTIKKVKKKPVSVPVPAKEDNKGGLSKKRITDPALTNQQRKILLIKRYKKVNKVWTKDGNIFVGAIVKDTPSKLTLVTVFGIVNVPKEKIAMSLKVDSKVEVK